MNEHPSSIQEIHVLFEHPFELENTLNEPCIICMTLYTESVADRTDHFANAFFRENVAYGYQGSYRQDKTKFPDICLTFP